MLLTGITVRIIPELMSGYAGIRSRADDEGLRHWTDILNSGANYNDILNGFLNSNEFKVISENYYKKVKIKEPDSDLVLFLAAQNLKMENILFIFMSTVKFLAGISRE